MEPASAQNDHAKSFGKKSQSAGAPAQAAPGPYSPGRGERGITLMEMLVATTMVSILGAIAVPQYAALSLQMRTDAGANRLMSDLAYARAMAIRTGVPHYIRTNTSAGPVDYQVRRSASATSCCAPTTDPAALRTVQLNTKLPGVNFALNFTADPYGTAVTQAVPTAGWLWFDGRGLPNVAGSYFVASNDGRMTHVVSVTGAGRIRLWTRSGTTWR